MSFERGSEWRRWDFHLHTPNTKKNDQFHGDNDEKWTRFYQDIKNYIGDGSDPQRKIAAVGITDYFSIENYKKIKADGILDQNIDFIFPNIELRCLPLKDGVKMNVHLLINPSFVDRVDTIILSNLIYKSATSTYCARKDDLIRYGKELVPGLDDERAYKKGVEEFHINFDDIIKIFNNYPECKNNVLVLMPNKSTDGASAVGNPSSPSQDLVDLLEYRKDLYKASDLILSANPSDIKFFSGEKDKKPSKIMPCVWGCDAHTNNAIFEPLDNQGRSTKRYCWIKADPTWEGLRQILFEPIERVRIQEFCPADRVDNYRIIDGVVIEDNVVPHRFSNEMLPINQNLTCIIGLKSTGKSILLQNIARAIDSSEVSLRLETVYNGKKKPLEFPVKVHWKDGTISYNGSSDDKKIVYIAQSYLNKLMDDRAEKTEIDQIIENIICQNKDFCDLRRSFDAKNIDIQKQIDSKILELVYKKKEFDSQVLLIKDLGGIESVKNNIELLRQRKEALAKTLNISTDDIARFDKAVEDKILLEKNIQILTADKKRIEDSEDVFVKINIEGLMDPEIAKKVRDVDQTISEEAKQVWQKSKTKIIDFISDRLNARQVEYAGVLKIINGLKPMIDNNAEIKKIEGDLRTEEDQLRKINDEYEILKNLRKALDDLINSILSLTTSREAEYDLFESEFKSIQFKDTDENFKIVAIKRRRRSLFKETITKIFTQSALKSIYNGVFKDLDNEQFILESEFNEDCKKAYINAVLENDTQKVLLSKYDKNHALQELLGDFDNIIYTIEMDGDQIENMSPGKKALVLLKLLISHDESKCPILLDQPEDDLDNLSIVSDLVSFIRDRKKDRQIILVTHNANLVLGCDAEEIIVANQQIENNAQTNNKSFRFEYRSGAIENITIIEEDTFLGSRGIQQHICNILEGGKEAFLARKNKYTNI